MANPSIHSSYNNHVLCRPASSQNKGEIIPTRNKHIQAGFKIEKLNVVEEDKVDERGEEYEIPYQKGNKKRFFRAARSIGVGGFNGEYVAAIHRGMYLPVIKRLEMTSCTDFQNTINFDIYEGNHQRADNNTYLGTVSLHGLCKDYAEQADIVVTFRLERDGMLYVTAKDRDSGAQDNMETLLRKVTKYWD